MFWGLGFRVLAMARECHGLGPVIVPVSLWVWDLDLRIAHFVV